MGNVINHIQNLISDERGDSEIIDTSIALILIMGLFIAFVVYSNSARVKVIMNFSAKEGARMYAISKSPSEGVIKANSYLYMGGVNSAVVNAVGNSGIHIENNLNVYVPFFNNDSNIKLISEFNFFEEFDPRYYERGSIGDGWLERPFVRTRMYDDDSWFR